MPAPLLDKLLATELPFLLPSTYTYVYMGALAHTCTCTCITFPRDTWIRNKPGPSTSIRSCSICNCRLSLLLMSSRKNYISSKIQRSTPPTPFTASQTNHKLIEQPPHPPPPPHLPASYPPLMPKKIKTRNMNKVWYQNKSTSKTHTRQKLFHTIFRLHRPRRQRRVLYLLTPIDQSINQRHKKTPVR